VRLCEEPSDFKFVYEESLPLWDKMKAIATKIYGASDITADSKVAPDQEAAGELRPLSGVRREDSVLVLHDPQLRGAPSGHVVNVREVRLAAGAEFVVMVCGDIMTMPGLPKVPSAVSIDITDEGKITGLF
jgi:formate--tetrahydrofolate ligase